MKQQVLLTAMPVPKPVAKDAEVLGGLRRKGDATPAPVATPSAR